MATQVFKETLSADIKAAMKAGEKNKLAALRLISAAVKQHEVDKRSDVDDDVAVELLARMVKQRRESISQYESAGRDDLAQKEHFELDLITAYLPQQLSADEIQTKVKDAIANTGASTMKDMGKVMGALNAELKGRADMIAVSAQVKAALSG